MPDGLTLAAFALLVALLYTWALQNRADDRVADIEAEHARTRNVLRIIDEYDEEQYRSQLQFDVELYALLREAA